MRRIIGIDPGSKGYICVLNEDMSLHFFGIAGHTKAEVDEFLKAFSEDAHAVMEEVHAIYNSAAGATFSFGEVVGFLHGLLVSNHIPYSLVPPKEWQKEIWTNHDKVFKVGKTIDTKKTSINAASRLFPDVDFRRNEQCRNIDDNKVDAALIAEYGRRKNL